MFVKYVTTNAPVIAQVISDMALLASGSPLSALSASCDQANSTRVATVAPGWTLVDSAAPLSGQVLSAPDADGLTTKYVRLFATSPVNIDIYAYEAWNSTTHVGTNQSYNNTRWLGFTAGVVNTFWLVVTPRTIWLTSGNNGIGCLEFTRDALYLKGTTYPAFAIASYESLSNSSTSNLWCNTPRIKRNGSSGDYTGVNATVAALVLVGRNGSISAPPGVPSAQVHDANDNTFWEVSPLWAGIGADNTTVYRPYVLGKFYDMFTTSAGAGNPLDTISDGTDTYVLLYGTNDLLMLKAA